MRDEYFPLITLTLAALFTCLVYLNRGPLYYDEAIYAQVAKEIIHRNQWLPLHWNQQLWFHKPPLYFWATALLFKTFGISELMARLVSALAGVGSVVLSYLIAKLIYDKVTGLITGLILISSALFVFNARHGMTDITMTFFILLSAYSYLRSKASPRWWCLVGTASALAVLTKGAAGLLAPATIMVSLMLDRRLRSAFRERLFWIGALTFVGLAGSWHVVSLLIHGSAFVDQYLFRHVLERSTSDLHEYNYGYFFYFGVLWNFFWPWSILAVPAIIFTIRKKLSWVLVVSTLLPFFLFSLATTKFQWYVVPMLPPLAIVIALFIRDMIEKIPGRTKPLAWLTVFAMVIIGGIEVVRYCKQDPEIQSVAEMARIAARDEGAISTAPESFEMTALFYSDRKLCVDPVVSPLSFQGVTKCEPHEIRHFIFQNDKRRLIESRFGPLQVLAERNGVSYGKVIGR